MFADKNFDMARKCKGVRVAAFRPIVVVLAKKKMKQVCNFSLSAAL